ncbi:MAG TPA: hypothetical protein VIS48_13360 [Candidatus Kryptonia bacterium]
MNFQKCLLLVGAILGLCVESCVPVYIPNTIDAPLLKNAGEVRIAANTGTTGWDFQTAVAVSGAIGIMANGSFGSKSSSDSLSYNVHNYLEGALGYYMPVTANGTMEMFAGAGAGRSTSSDAWTNSSSSQIIATGWYTRYFFQMDIGAYGDIADGGFGMRASYVHFTKIQDKEGNITSNLDGLFAEPFIFGALGGPGLKFTAQMGVSWPLRDNIRFQWMPFVMNVGLQVNINRK